MWILSSSWLGGERGARADAGAQPGQISRPTFYRHAPLTAWAGADADVAGANVKGFAPETIEEWPVRLVRGPQRLRRRPDSCNKRHTWRSFGRQCATRVPPEYLLRHCANYPPYHQMGDAAV